MGNIPDSPLNREAPRSLRWALMLSVAGVFLPYAYQNLFLLVLVIWAWWFRCRVERKEIAEIPALSQIWLWAWTLVSLLWSVNREEGITEVLSKVQWLIWPLIFIAVRPWIAPYFRWFARCIWVSALLVSLLCTADVLWRSNAPAFWFQDMVYENLARASGLHPIYLSMWILLALVAYVKDQVIGPQSEVLPIQGRFLDLPKNNPKAYGRHTAYLLFTVWMVTQLSSRMAMLTGLAMIVVLLMILIRLGKFRWSIAAGLAILMLIPWLLIQINTVNRSRVSEMVDLQADHTTNRWGGRSLRIAKWKSTLQCYAISPVLGTGAGDFQTELNRVYRFNHLETGYNNHFNSHNQYLQTLATLGPIGLLLLLLSLVYPLWRAWQQQQWESLMVFVILLSSMLTESMLERQKGLYIVGLMSNGYFWGMLQRRTTPPNQDQGLQEHAS